MRILVVEDDELTANALVSILANQNYAVEVATDGQEGWNLVETYPYDLVLLDIQLPKVDGISLCRQMRSKNMQMPILLLTGYDSGHDKAIGLDAGADDYVVKPFDGEELVARVRALLRRAGSSAQPILECGDLKLDPSNCEVTYGGAVLSLTPKEYALLELFMRNRRRVFSCGMILEHLWAYEDTPGEEAVRTHIKGLRQKLKAAGVPSDLIETVYGIGYRLKPKAEEKERDRPTATQSGTQKQKTARSATPSDSVQHQTLALINKVWERHQGRINEQLDTLEQAIAHLSEGRSEALEQARQEAHTLAGSLGTFGFSEGSRFARSIEQHLKAGKTQKPKEIQQLQQLMTALRQDLERSRSDSASALTSPVESAPDDRPLLLMVDRDRALADQLMAQVSAWGLRGEVVTDLKQARQRIDQASPSVVLLDPIVSPTPEESLALLADLNKQSPPLPVVVFSAQDRLRDRLEVVRMGGRTFLHKPASVEQVLEAVTQILKQADSARSKVMAVDDDPAVLAVLRTLLEPWGLKVTTLQDPERFWETLGAVSPDLLILDVEMPNFSGIDLCQVVRNDPQWSELPILFLTVHSDADVVNRVFAAGADDFISKPIIGPELVTRIINRLERIRLLKRMTETNLAMGRMDAGPEGEGSVQPETNPIFALSLDLRGQIGANGHVKQVNPAFEATLGFSRAEWLDQPFLDRVYPGDRTATQSEMLRLTEGMPSVYFENRCISKDGSYRWLAWTLTANPHTRLIDAIARDITTYKQTEVALRKAKDETELRVAERTGELVSLNQRLQRELEERRQVEAALRISQARFSGILSIADDAIISINSQQKITLFNQGAEKMFGYTADEAIGQPLDVLIPLRFMQAHRQHVSEFGRSPSQARKMAERNEIFGRRKDGTEFPAEASISKLDLGQETVYTVILRDITARRQMERVKDEFVSVVSHELRTPLTSIHGSLGMLASGLLKADSDQGKRLLQIAVDSTERLVRLINDILDIERIESGRVMMQKEACDVADLMAEAVNVVQAIADKAGVTLSVTSLSAQLWADPDRIVQTLTNLLSNAIKFSGRGSTVWLSATTRDTPSSQSGPSDSGNGSVTIVPPIKEILFQVQDHGRGIPSDKLESIFERFQQVDSSDSRDHEGTGLGLAICRSIVQQHGGEIWVESVLGEGSTFYFTLPMTPPPGLIPESEKTGCPVSGISFHGFSSALSHTALETFVPASESPLVLICDDDPAILTVLQTMLQQRDYQVMTATSGQEAIAQAVSQRPDVILLDLLMPSMNGWDTMAALKQQAETRDIPIVICSVCTPTESSVQSSSHPQNYVDWVSKPLNEAHLFQSLHQAMSHSPAGVRVLIVEDDDDLAEVLMTLFERHSIQTFHARTGRDAIHLSQDVNPDLLVLDLVLPEVDGFTVVEWLQQHNRLCNIPLVVYSAKDLDASERDRLKLGHTEFLTKGRVTTQDFEQRVMGLLQRITKTNLGAHEEV